MIKVALLQHGEVSRLLVQITGTICQVCRIRSTLLGGRSSTHWWGITSMLFYDWMCTSIHLYPFMGNYGNIQWQSMTYMCVPIIRIHDNAGMTANYHVLTMAIVGMCNRRESWMVPECWSRDPGRIGTPWYTMVHQKEKKPKLGMVLWESMICLQYSIISVFPYLKNPQSSTEKGSGWWLDMN